VKANLQVAYETNVLDEQRHYRLVQELAHYATIANIPKEMILQSAKKYCLTGEMDWLKGIRHREPKKSLAFVDIESSETAVELRMMALTAVCLRNFIDARLMTVQDVVTDYKNNTLVDPTILLIPNFFVSEEHGGFLASWDISNLMGLLISRLTAGHLTVIGISDLKSLEKEYGTLLSNHIKNNYSLVN